MNREEETEVRVQLAELAQKINGGPGLAAICKMHQESVNEIKSRMSHLEEKMDQGLSRISYWGGVVAAIVFIFQVAIPLVLHFVKTKP